MKEEKILKAKNIKMERLRHKSSILFNSVLIEENKNKELRKKMKSAGFIRKDKGKAKVSIDLRKGNQRASGKWKEKKH